MHPEALGIPHQEFPIRIDFLVQDTLDFREMLHSPTTGTTPRIRFWTGPSGHLVWERSRGTCLTVAYPPSILRVWVRDRSRQALLEALHSKLFPLLDKEGSRFNQRLAMDENAPDTLLVRQLPDLHVPTEFANFVPDIRVQHFNVPLFREVDDTSG